MMKKNIYRLQVVFLLVAGLLSATSCNDWLDVKPKTEEEAEELFSTIDGLNRLWPECTSVYPSPGFMAGK